MSGQPIRFIDLDAQRRRLEPALTRAIKGVLATAAFIGGPKVQELEAELAKASGARHCVGCANGTDALLLALMAWGIGPGDAVFVPAFSFIATAGVVAHLGATPVFVDVEADSFNIDPKSLKAAIAATRRTDLRPAAVIPVDLFGQPADYEALEAIAKEEGLRVLADAAQSFGAERGRRKVGTFGDATATSFYPSKPLGCYGDGGAILVPNEETAAVLRSLREHGYGSHRYESVRVGLNSRLDAIQAVVLIEKLKIFGEEIAARERVAARYAEHLSDLFAVPALAPDVTSVWAQYTLRVADRESLSAACKARGVPTAVHYPIALSDQPAFRKFPRVPGGVPVSERLARSVLSLPMHPYLDAATQDVIIAALRDAVAAPGRKATA